MYFKPMPIEHRSCQKCNKIIRFFRENSGEAIDLYSCNCHVLYAWDGKVRKLVDKLEDYSVKQVDKKGQLGGLPVDSEKLSFLST